MRGRLKIENSRISCAVRPISKRPLAAQAERRGRLSERRKLDLVGAAKLAFVIRKKRIPVLRRPFGSSICACWGGGRGNTTSASEGAELRNRRDCATVPR